MTTTRIYKSTDSGAPVLTGQAGSLLNLLDKCLVDGYGSKTAAGWTRSYTGTNKTSYRNSIAAGGTGMHLRVLDDGSGTGGAREALCRAYLTMSDIDTGTIETPTAAQVSTSIVWRKSNTTDSTARPWLLIADELTFYLCIDTGTVASEYGAGTYGAGDFASDVPGDAYRFFVCGRESQQGADQHGVHAGFFLSSNAFTEPTSQSFWLARGYAGTGSPVRAAFMYPLYTRIGTNGSIANPSPGSSLNYWIPGIIVTQSSFRGRMRGIYLPLNSHVGVAIGTEVVNPPGLTGTIVAMRHNSDANGASAVHDCHFHIDKTNAWPL